MNVLLIGADGFIGRHVYDEIRDSYNVATTIGPNSPDVEGRLSTRVDIHDNDAIRAVIQQNNPNVIISCVGVVDPNASPEANSALTRSILEAAKEDSGERRRVILMGSAASYGLLSSADELPVAEDTPLRAEAGYALSKRREEEYAVQFGQDNNLDVVVARVFNPIGVGMKDRFLIPALIRQINDVRVGGADTVTVSRLDSERDYIDVRDVARAVKALADSRRLTHTIYNVGSGIGTTNRMLVDSIIEDLGLARDAVRVDESSSEKEKPLASCADIRRIEEETDWRPQIPIETTIKEIVNAAK